MVSDRERSHLVASLERAIPYAKNGMISVSVESAKEIIDLLERYEPKRTFKNQISRTTCGVCGSVLSITVHSIPD